MHFVRQINSDLNIQKMKDREERMTVIYNIDLLPIFAIFDKVDDIRNFLETLNTKGYRTKRLMSCCQEIIIMYCHDILTNYIHYIHIPVHDIIIQYTYIIYIY